MLCFHPQSHMVLPCDVTEDDSCFSGSAISPFFVQERYFNYVSFVIIPGLVQQISSAVFNLQ